MKNSILIIVLLVFIANTSFAQHRRGSMVKWLSIELKGAYGGSMLLNSDIASDKNVELALFSPAYEFGGRLALTFGDYISIGVELLSSSFNQDYNINVPNKQVYTKTQSFKSTDILLALRYTNLYGFYVELGPKFSTIKKAKVTNSINEAFTDDIEPDYAAHFVDKFTGIMAGFGFAVYNGDRLRVNVGIRTSYALSNIVDDGNFYVLNDGFYHPIGSFSSNTNPLTVQLSLGVNYVFGFWGNATCGRGRLVFFQ